MLLVYQLGILLGLAEVAKCSASDFYLGDAHIIPLSDSNFKAVIAKHYPRPLLVEFYSPGCPHCVSFKGTWTAVGKNLAGHLPVAAVNCQHSQLCARFGVQGVPSIKMLLPGKSAAAATPTPIEYNGARDVKGVVEFAERHVPSRVLKVGNSKGVMALDEFLKQRAELPRAILFKRGTWVAAMPYKTLSVDLEAKMVLGICNLATDGPELAKRLGVSLPSADKALVLIKPRSATGKLYTGNLQFTELSKHLRSFVEGHREEDPKQEL